MPVQQDSRTSTGRLARLAHLLKMACLLLALPGAAGATTSFAGPDGWRQMCADTPDYCNLTQTAVSPPLAPVEIARLTAVNTAVNAAILPLDEPPGEDVWRLAPLAGDCEDYALTKKHRLIATGFPAERLRFATVLTEANEYHAVLLVDDAERWLVLDNRFDAVRDWTEAEASGYRLIAVEGLGASGAWHLTPYGTLVAMLIGSGPAAAR
jgi:predicted transglutaminase-like cysteine proteinase